MRSIAVSVAAFVISTSVIGDRLFAQASPSPFTSATRYDADGRIIGTIAPDPDGSGPIRYFAVRNTYDNSGNIIKIEKGELSSWQSEAVSPNSWPGFAVSDEKDIAYDTGNRKIKEVESSSGILYRVTQYGYDPVGRLECVSVRMDPTQWDSQTDSCSAQNTSVNGSDRTQKNVYDPAGRLIQIRKAVGTPLEQAYVTYSYTPNGKQQYVIDALGNRAQLIYDGFDRQTASYFPSPTQPGAFNGATQATALATAGAASAADYEAYGYDVNGNRTGLRRRDGRFICSRFDALNRASAKFYLASSQTLGACQTSTPSGTDAVYYGYDSVGHQLYARFGSASGPGIANAYDGLGRMTSSTSTMGGVSRALSYQYDADNNRTRITFPDGTYFTTIYDGLDRPTTIQQSGTTTVVSETWDASGRRSAEKRGAVPIGYGYDAISRLASISHDLAGTTQDLTLCFGTLSGAVCTPSYNPASQIMNRTASNDAYAWTGGYNLSRAYTANGLNQYATVSGAAQSYDANGNMLSGGGVTYGYDIENRLVSTSSGVALTYDPLGRLFQTSGGSAGITQYLYDGDALVAEYSASGTLLRRYVHGNDDDDPMLWYEGAGLTDMRSMQVDERGSIVSIANSAGTVLNIDSYDEYGIPGSTNAGRFQYTGQVWLPELGMYYYKARIYSPTLGRFMQTDPIGYKDQINLYAYVANDPVNGVDPSGDQMVLDPEGDKRTEQLKAQINVGLGTGLYEGIKAGGKTIATLAAVVPLGEEAPAAKAAQMGVEALGDVAKAAARGEAAAARADGATAGASSALVTPDGSIVTGRSLNSGGPGAATNPQVQSALDNVTTPSAYHGCCGEVHALSKALNAGESVAGGVMATVRTTTEKVMQACSSCRAVMDYLGVKY